jgi:agmatine deiminase
VLVGVSVSLTDCAARSSVLPRRPLAGRAVGPHNAPKPALTFTNRFVRAAFVTSDMTLALTTDTTVAPEWAPQQAIWTAWPADPKEWNGDLDTPRRDVEALVRALIPFNTVRVLVHGEEAEQSARAALPEEADIVPAHYGDIWVRDTGPIFGQRAGDPVALRFRTNGWGGKFDLDGDATIGDEIAQVSGTPTARFDFILEGGAIDHDGEGTVLTTRQTLLNTNRNGWTADEAEAALRAALGTKKVIWIDEGLAGDHTDGHVDNVARFVGPARIVCQAPAGPDDPNADILEAIAARLATETDASGQLLQLVRIPSPGRVLNAEGEVAPASHLNFVIANGIVVVPLYNTATAQAALHGLRAVFPDRQVVGLPSFGLLGTGIAGGGSFHCITREEPAR